MTVTIMIDGSVRCNRKFGFKLQSLHVIEKPYNYYLSGSDLKLCNRIVPLLKTDPQIMSSTYWIFFVVTSSS